MEKHIEQHTAETISESTRIAAQLAEIMAAESATPATAVVTAALFIGRTLAAFSDPADLKTNMQHVMTTIRRASAGGASVN